MEDSSLITQLSEELLHHVLVSGVHDKDDALFDLGVRASVQRACRFAATLRALALS